MIQERVDVAIAMYNSEKFITQTIKSISNQTYQNWHIFIVDDYSKDRSIIATENAINDFGIGEKVTFLKHNQNYGYGKTLKDAIEEGDGEYITIVDSDDALATNKAFQIMIDIHIKYPKVSLTYSNFWLCDKHLKPIIPSKARALKKGETFFSMFGKVRISHLKCIKREYYNQTTGVNGKLLKSVDKDLVLKLEEVGNLIYVDELLYLYRQHPHSLTNSFCGKPKQFRDMINKMRIQILEDARIRRSKLKK